MIKHILAAILVTASPALAGDPKFWGDYPPEVHEWFPTVMQPDNPATSCCGEADAFEGKVVGDGPYDTIAVQIDDGKYAIPDGTVVYAPKAKIQTKFGNPTGKLIVFISTSDHHSVYCLIPEGELY